MGPETLILVVMLAMAINAVLVLAGVVVFYLSLKLYTEYKKDRMMDSRAGGGGKPGAEALLRLLAAGSKARAKTPGGGAGDDEAPAPGVEDGTGSRRPTYRRP